MSKRTKLVCPRCGKCSVHKAKRKEIKKLRPLLVDWAVIGDGEPRFYMLVCRHCGWWETLHASDTYYHWYRAVRRALSGK